MTKDGQESVKQAREAKEMKIYPVLEGAKLESKYHELPVS